VTELSEARLFHEFALELHRFVQRTPKFWNYRPRVADLGRGGEDMKELDCWNTVEAIGLPKGGPPKDAKLLPDRLPRKVKRHFLGSELKTADDLSAEYVRNLLPEAESPKTNLAA